MSQTREAGAADARVGIYGGTVNPIHLGHLRAAEEVVQAFGLERMLFVPAAIPPHKCPTDDVIAPALARLAWVREAIRGNPRFDVDDLEIERQGPSYSVETLRAIGARLAPARPVFTIGWDAFVEIGSWREPRELFRLAHFAATARPPVSPDSLAAGIPSVARGDFELDADGRSGRHRESGTWIRLIEISALDISATEVRRSIRRGRSVRYLVPESVREAILESGCYHAGAAPHDEPRSAEARPGQ